MSETDYINQIQQLVDLQKVDDEIFEVRRSLENAPRDLEELKNGFDEVDAKRNVVLDKLSHLNEQKKRLSLEIEDDSARIKKSKNKMMNVGNTREYHAMVREMDNMEKSSRTREEERATLLDEIQRQEEALAEIDVSHGRLKEEVEQKSATLEQTLAGDRDRLAVLNGQRAQFSKGIPLPIFRRYEFIRSRLEHPVIVGVVNGICSGCHIAIPPQKYIELQKSKQIHSCPNCQRLIYWSEHFGPLPGAEADGENDDAEDRGIKTDRGAARKASNEVWPEDMIKSEPAPMQPEKPDAAAGSEERQQGF